MEEKKKKKFAINHHVIIVAILAIVVIICITRLLQWNQRNKTVDLTGINAGDADETLDYYVYPPTDYDDGHVDNGVEDILVFGNVLINNSGKEHSILNILRDELDANIIDLSVDKSILTSRSINSCLGQNCFSLYHLMNSIVNQYYNDQLLSDPLEEFETQERYDEFIDRFMNVDMMEIDTVIIMYSLQDYYACMPHMFTDEHYVTGYLGALLSTVELIKENYPHIQIIISSPCPVYSYDADGNIALGTLTDYGWGNTSIYIESQSYVASKECVSLIDNYGYVIDEENITEYSDGFWPNDKGIDLIASHMVNFIKNKGQQ